MAVLTSRSIGITLTGDVNEDTVTYQANNSNGPAYRQVVNLASGNNTITVPTGVTVAAVTILPPSGNTSALTFKGINGDTGVALHKTDPSSIGLDTTVATFVLNAGAAMTGVVLIWT